MTDSRPPDLRRAVAHGPADLLALVPSVLGFHPEDSAVLLTVGDAVQCFHARVDLPTDPDETVVIATHLAGVAGRHRAEAVAVVTYSDDAVATGCFVAEIAARLRDEGVPLVCAVRADGERWWRLTDRPDAVSLDLVDPLGPAEGTPYDVRSHPWLAEAVLEGRVVRRNRRELADTLVGTDPEEAELVDDLAGEVLLGIAQAGPPQPGGPGRARLVLEGRWVQHRVRSFLGDGLRLDTPDVARLAAGIGWSLELRDVAWAEMSRSNARGHVDLWSDVVRRVPLRLRPAPAALLGFAAWLVGDGALAWCAVDRAEEAEPGYNLTRLLAQALEGALPPSVWEPFPVESLTLFADRRSAG